jgi:hypothetical protein
MEQEKKNAIKVSEKTSELMRLYADAHRLFARIYEYTRNCGERADEVYEPFDKYDKGVKSELMKLITTDIDWALTGCDEDAEVAI